MVCFTETFFIMQHHELDEISSSQICAFPNRKAEFWLKVGTTGPKELFFCKKLFVAISINFGNNILSKSFGGLTLTHSFPIHPFPTHWKYFKGQRKRMLGTNRLMEYYSSIFGSDYNEDYLYFLEISLPYRNIFFL